MRYIKTKEEYSINEEINIPWKGVIYGLCIGAMIKYYFPDKRPLTRDEIDQVINDIDNTPSTKENALIKNVKVSLINDIKLENDLSDDQKRKLINEINTIPFISIDKETIELIASEGTLGCYFVHFNSKNQLVKAILVNNERLASDTAFSETILHELRHLIDDSLSSDSRNSYSELSNIVDILDKDIILRNSEGSRKVKEKVKVFVQKTTYNLLDDKSRITSPEVKDIMKDLEGDYFKTIFLNKKTMTYLTSPDEIYARFHGLKKWMIKNGYLKDINDQITQDIIIKMLDDKKMSDNNIIFKDFFQLLFYLNIDFTGKTKSDLTKANSIVANYTDYVNKPIV